MDANETLSRRAYFDLRSDIIFGRLKPDSRLKLGALGKRYRVGTTPIREALHLLSSEGMVRHTDQRGFRVSGLSLSEYTDILETRCWFEERALRNSIENGDAAWEDEIVLSEYRLSQTARTIDSENGEVMNPEWEMNHQRFHMALIAACDSPILLKYCAELCDQNSRYCFIAYISSDIRPSGSVDHAKIAQAALKRDADLACQLLIAHYRKAGEVLKSSLQSAVDSCA